VINIENATGMKKKNAADSINIAGVILNRRRTPNLYKLAQSDPAGLEARLMGLNKASGPPCNLTTTAILLENDLEHDVGMERPDLPDWFRNNGN
jgi:hypothetical protein